MKQVKKILFPIDLADDNYGKLLPWVSTFVEKFDATLYVAFVALDLSSYNTFYLPHGIIEDFQVEAKEAAQKHMADVAKDQFQNFPKLETRVLRGSPAESLLELAEQENIDLIIMGIHGREGLKRVFLGSVAHKVVTAAHCPVMTIHQ